LRDSIYKPDIVGILFNSIQFMSEISLGVISSLFQVHMATEFKSGRRPSHRLLLLHFHRVVIHPRGDPNSIRSNMNVYQA
jgi:hypothetical protein